MLGKNKAKGLSIIIVGCGRVGTTLVEQLSAEGHDITIVDKDRDVVTELTNLYDIMGVVGNGASFTTQIVIPRVVKFDVENHHIGVVDSGFNLVCQSDRAGGVETVADALCGNHRINLVNEFCIKQRLAARKCDAAAFFEIRLVSNYFFINLLCGVIIVGFKPSIGIVTISTTKRTAGEKNIVANAYAVKCGKRLERMYISHKIISFIKLNDIVLSLPENIKRIIFSVNVFRKSKRFMHIIAPFIAEDVR